MKKQFVRLRGINLAAVPFPRSLQPISIFEDMIEWGNINEERNFELFTGLVGWEIEHEHWYTPQEVAYYVSKLNSEYFKIQLAKILNLLQLTVTYDLQLQIGG